MQAMQSDTWLSIAEEALAALLLEDLKSPW